MPCGDAQKPMQKDTIVRIYSMNQADHRHRHDDVVRGGKMEASDPDRTLHSGISRISKCFQASDKDGKPTLTNPDTTDDGELMSQ